MTSDLAAKGIGAGSSFGTSFLRDIRTRYPRSFSFLNEAAVALLFLTAYWFLDRLSFIYIHDRLNITPWNPPVAASIILLFMRGLLWSPLLFGAALSCQLLFETPDVPLDVVIITAASEAILYTTAVWLLIHRFKISPHLASLRDAIIFAVTIVAASGCMGVAYILIFYAAGIVSAQASFPLIAEYWAGDCLGILVLVPFFMVNWPKLRNISFRTRFSREALCQTALTVLLVPVVMWLEKNNIHLFYTFFIPLIWAAISGGLARVTWIVLATQLAIIFSSWQLQIAAPVTLKFLPFIMSVIACMGLILGSVIDERERIRLSNFKNDARLKAILDMAPDSMMIVDTQGYVVAANKNFIQIYDA